MVFGEPPWPKIGEEDLSVRVTNDLFVDFGIVKKGKTY